MLGILKAAFFSMYVYSSAGSILQTPSDVFLWNSAWTLWISLHRDMFQSAATLTCRPLSTKHWSQSSCRRGQNFIAHKLAAALPALNIPSIVPIRVIASSRLYILMRWFLY
jgi:hypothetical protein